MKMMELRGFLTNLGKYNEGELCGKWVEFPMTEEEFAEHLEDIGIDGHRYEEYFWTDWESEEVDVDMFGEYESIDTVNNIAEMTREDLLGQYYDLYPDDWIYPMDMFDEVMGIHEPSDIARRVFNGNFNPNHDYFMFNGVLNLVSFHGEDERNKREDVYVQDIIRDIM